MKSTRFETSTFANGAAFARHAPEERRYREAVQAFSSDASPAAISSAIAAARRYGFRLTKADVREAAVAGLRDRLLALPGYTEADVRWHAARRGRRERHLYA
ncbi:hypothetical protein XH99_31820 [Bradyrhizobium nanningense]|uniref:Uncharacterized protein n=1 Tax=Bradyrhizobium nanningense TaxID=1325118 RepID=A0A4Q0RUK7_9BRAD|nr:hypothetical protein [Bradyrhizobium nanningense]RXH23302.1 hypothetical protein XH99_31820 [Bradyrhizobium nanningense]RXH27597.1 hypothetical protein XH84_29815 [Bradyrhizobium nanningense]